MGSVYSRKNKKGETWYVQYYFNSELVREKVGQSWKGVTRKQAVEALKSREGDIVQGRFNIAQTKSYPKFNITIEKYLDWSASHKRSHRQELYFAKQLTAFFGTKKLDEINPLMVERYKKMRKDDIKGRPRNAGKSENNISYIAINRELALLRHFFTMSIKWGLIDKNPVSGVKMFPERTRERYLTEEEIPELLNACEESQNESLKIIVFVALNTGMRLGEILNLRVADIDLQNMTINIEQSKTGKGTVPISNCLGRALAEHLQEHDQYYLFCDNYGNPYKSLKNSFKTALKRAGIENFRFHDLRHTFASHLAMNGIEGRTLQELGRWQTPKMVMRYAHLSEKHKKAAVDTLGSLFVKKDNAKNIAGTFSALPLEATS